MINISICIPTFNRAHLLGKCLKCLSKFSDKDFELIVGDNASSDETSQEILNWQSVFPNFEYIRHDNNIGFARNMDSLVRRATRKYVYILSDDDIVFEDALRLSANIMNANNEIVAIVGKYLSTRSLDDSIRIDYSNAIATRFQKGSHALLIENLSVCDGHPVMRRDAFERYGAYLDRTFGLTPLYFSLLHHGDIVSIDKPFFQHLTNEESLSGSMAEAWFVDTVNTDIELSIAACISAIVPERTHAVRQRFLQLIYFQAGRMAINQRSYYLFWVFLRRLAAIYGASDELLLKCEYYFMHDFLIGRIASVLRDAKFKKVLFEDSPFCHSIIQGISPLLPGVVFIQSGSAVSAESAEILICLDKDKINFDEQKLPRIVAISDFISQLRLLEFPAEINILNGRITLKYSQDAVIKKLLEPSDAFHSICAKYSAEKAGF